ncbi:MAG: hypothetical protein AVDCRST_MAG86-4371, partial [uncultured Truepera sp.]
ERPPAQAVGARDVVVYYCGQARGARYQSAREL